MTEVKINLPAVILKTSFSVSIVFALSLGILVTIYSQKSFNFFLYSSYLFFVNNLIFPVSIVTILNFYLYKKDIYILNFIGRIRAILLLSGLTLVILFLWNSVDFLFLFHQNKEFTTDYIINGLQEEFMFGLYLAIPIALSVYFAYRWFNKENYFLFSTKQ